MAHDPAAALSSNNDRKENRYPVGVIAGFCFLAIVVAALLLLSGKHAASPEPASSSSPSDTVTGYASQLAFSDLHLSAEENFIGQQVVYLDGKLTNTGAKTVREL